MLSPLATSGTAILPPIFRSDGTIGARDFTDRPLNPQPRKTPPRDVEATQPTPMQLSAMDGETMLEALGSREKVIAAMLRLIEENQSRYDAVTETDLTNAGFAPSDIAGCFQAAKSQYAARNN